MNERPFPPPSGSWTSSRNTNTSASLICSNSPRQGRNIGCETTSPLIACSNNVHGPHIGRELFAYARCNLWIDAHDEIRIRPLPGRQEIGRANRQAKTSCALFARVGVEDVGYQQLCCFELGLHQRAIEPGSVKRDPPWVQSAGQGLEPLHIVEEFRTRSAS